jgi:hypothetical protein
MKYDLFRTDWLWRWKHSWSFEMSRTAHLTQCHISEELHLQQHCSENLRSQAPSTLSVKLTDFTVWHHTWQKNWVNGAVVTDNSAGLRTILSSHLSRRELHSSLRESHKHSFQFFMHFFYAVKLHSLTWRVWGPLHRSLVYVLDPLLQITVCRHFVWHC